MIFKSATWSCSQKNRSTTFRIIALLFAATSALAVTSCSEGSSVSPESDLLVVRAYLYAGEPVFDIQLSQAAPLGADDTAALHVNDAEVTLMRNGDVYPLIPSPGDSGMYHYPGSDLEVRQGDRFDLAIRWRERTIGASAVVPDKPEDVTITRDTIRIPENADPSVFREDSMQIVFGWSNPYAGLFFVAVENVESEPEEIVLGNGTLARARGRFISPPTDVSSYRLIILSLTHYGRHRARVYRVNREYADLYRSRSQNSRDLNEPLTNIVNGLGFFRAFNSVIVYFYVLKA